MIRFPNCKINLGLYVTNRREDGYHDIETVFFPLALHDVLEVVEATSHSALHLSGRSVSGNIEENLVWRAYELLGSLYPQQVKPIDIYLHKALPMGAGLGGGSADGAFMLAMLNDYYKLGLSDDELAGLALQLGSDCPFFIYNKPCFAKGRGEKLEPLPLDISGYSVQLICPEVHVSTGQAFQKVSPRPASFDLRRLPQHPVMHWKELISNDFEPPVFAAHPELQQIKDQLYHQGAFYASLTGSGSAIYGLFQKGQKAVVNSRLSFETLYIE